MKPKLLITIIAILGIGLALFVFAGFYDASPTPQSFTKTVELSNDT